MIKNLLFKKASQDIFWYLLTNFWKGLLPFIILPILTIYLTPAEYGYWSIYLALISFTLPLIAFGQPMILARNYHQYDSNEHAKMSFAALTSMFLLFTFILSIIFIYSIFDDYLLGIKTKYYLFLPLICLLQSIYLIFQTIIVHQNRAKLFFAINTAHATTLHIGGLFAVIYIYAHWLSLLATIILSSLGLALIGFYYLIKEQRLKINFKWRRSTKILLMGGPIIFHVIGSVIMTVSDRIILEKMTTIDDVGVYSIGANIGMSILLICTAFNQKWGPFLYKKLKAPTHADKVKIIKYSYLYFAMTITIAFFIVIAGYIYIAYFIDSSYADASDYLPWITAGACFYGMSLIVAHYIVILGKTLFLPTITMSAALVNIFATIYLVNLNGPIGAAQATFISYFILFFMMWFINMKKYPMPWFSFHHKS